MKKSRLSLLVSIFTLGILLMSLTLACAKSTTTTVTATAKPTTVTAPPTTVTATPTTSVAPTTTAAAQDAATFYGNNVLNIIIGSGVGGGNDYAARLFAQYWQIYVPGGSTRTTNVLTPTFEAANKVYKAKPDGLTIVVTESGGALLGPPYFGDAAATYDLAKLNYIGAFGRAPTTFAVSPKAKWNSIDDMRGAGT